MKLVECYADGYRNLNRVHIRPAPGINIIYGQNAQGKTNFIEGIGLFSGRRNLRPTGEGRLIGLDRELASLQIKFDDGQRVQTGEILLGRKNKFLLNRVPLSSIHEFAGSFYTVAFSPVHLSVVQGEPRLRRKFVDEAIRQIRPDYHSYCRQYDRVLSQRNALLKRMGRAAQELLDVWDLQMARLGTILTIMRQDYVAKIAPFLEAIYRGISTGREKLSIAYQSTVFEQQLDDQYTDDKVQAYLRRLEQQRAQDMETGHTGVGVHRDDLVFTINGRNVRDYGSQGQQRSTVIVLKLAEAKLLKSISGTEPVVLLDDVMSELDISRQDYILNHVKNNQVFITCCDITNTLRLQKGKVYHMENGSITKETEETGG